jgi:glycine cleavage system H protein
MSNPADCRYSETHEWFRQSGNTVTMGITQHAADALTDVTYVQAKAVGTTVAAGGSIGEVESVKTTSEVYSPFAGTIAAVNDEVIKDPSLINSDPYGKGWICRLTVSGEVLGGLLDAKTYDAKTGH